MPEETPPDILSFFMPQSADQATAMLAALQRQQGDQQARQEELRGRLAQQTGQAGNMRNLALLTSLGANPLLQGLNRTASQQGEAMSGEAARTESLLGQAKAGGIDPMRLVALQQAAERLRQTKQAADANAEAEKKRLEQADKKIALAERRANAQPKAHAAPKAPTLPATEVASLADIDVALKALDDLQKDHARVNGLMSSLTGKVPNTESKQYNDKKNAVIQMVGTILEHGKMTDGDIPKYERMMPQLVDDSKSGGAKVNTLKKMLSDQGKSRVTTFGQAGYNVQGIKTPDINLDAPPTAAPKTVANPRDFARTFEGPKGKFGQDKAGNIWQIMPDGTLQPVNVKR